MVSAATLTSSIALTNVVTPILVAIKNAAVRGTAVWVVLVLDTAALIIELIWMEADAVLIILFIVVVIAAVEMDGIAVMVNAIKASDLIYPLPIAY